MIAVVAGATGLTGQAILRELTLRPEITQVRALARKPDQVLQHPKVEPIAWPSPDLAPDGVDVPGDVFFCALGTTILKAGSREAFRKVDFELALQFARMAKRVGASRFALVSASGSHLRSPFFYSRVKAELEHAIQTLNFAHLTIARPGLLIGDRKERRRAERVAILTWRALAPLLPASWSRALGIPVEALARELVSEALRP